MIADISQLRRDIAVHGITWEQKCWLIFRYQGGICPICLEPIVVKGAHIDHFHGCANVLNHKNQNAGCVQCIRGALHRYCNGTIVYALEKYPHLQNDHIRQYLLRRPFMGIEGTKRAEEPVTHPQLAP
jgi:recombination endonuclease VII